MPYEHPESVFMLFVAISSIFMSLFKGHVACWNFSLTGSPYTQLFLHPLPRETRWGTPDVKWHGWSNGGKNQNLKKISTNPKPPKKSHGGFVSLKNFQKALNLITRKIPKTYSPNVLIRKNPGIKTFELKKILRSSLHLKFGVPPWGPTGPTSIIILFLTIPISIRRKCSGSRKTAWIFHQILSSNSLRKCQEINVENLCVNIRANVFSVCLFLLGGAKLIK